VKYAEEITEELNPTYFLQIRVKIQISGSFMDGRFVLQQVWKKSVFCTLGIVQLFLFI